MPGERDPVTLLMAMKPEIRDGVFVFCTVVEREELPADVIPMLTFYEAEGTTFVIRLEEAEHVGLAYEFPSRLITLTVYSSLEAVGFLAAITARLANAVSA